MRLTVHIPFRSKLTVAFSLLVALSVVVALLISARSNVHANGSYIALSVNRGHPSLLVKVNGTSFGVSESISITFDATYVGNAITDSNGTFSTRISIPGTAVPGDHLISATGSTSGITASASFLVETDWLMLGFSANHHRTNPYENTLNPANVSNLVQDWSITTSKGIGSEDAVISDGIIYFVSPPGLDAVNAVTGSLLWSKPLGDGVLTSSPMVANGLVYVDAFKNTKIYGRLYALNAKTGAIRWVIKGAGPFSSPTIVNNILYVGGSQNTFYALNAITGSVLWFKTLNSIPNYITDSPAVVNGVIYIAVNGATTATMYALNASTGAILWSTLMGGSVSYSSPAVASSLVYIGAGDGLLYAFNAADGTIDWTSPNIGNVIASPAVANGMVYIGGNGIGNHMLFAFNAKTGSLIWTSQTNGNIISSPTEANSVVYVGSMDHNLYAFDALNGTTLWTGATGGSIEFSSPIVANGVVYIGSDDYSFYAFHLPATTS